MSLDTSKIQVWRWSLCSGAATSRGSSGWQSWTPSSTCLAYRLLNLRRWIWKDMFSLLEGQRVVAKKKRDERNDLHYSPFDKGGVVSEEFITALGCAESVDRKRSQSHPWKVPDHIWQEPSCCLHWRWLKFLKILNLPLNFRSVSVKFGLEVWAEGDSSEQFHQKLKEVAIFAFSPVIQFS